MNTQGLKGMNAVKFNVGALEGITLDYAVWQVIGMFDDNMFQNMTPKLFMQAWRANTSKYEVHPSSNWGHGGNIIDSEGIDLLSVYEPQPDQSLKVVRYLGKSDYNLRTHNYDYSCIGKTKLEAAMRCVVNKSVGVHIFLPEEFKDYGGRAG